MQDHRKVSVWIRAHAHILEVNRATKRFPRSGYSSLRSQLTRSVESISFNIVEGCASSSQKELARFLEISIKSAAEAEYHLLLAQDYGVMTVDPKLATRDSFQRAPAHSQTQ
jgi:four helix bundle protein